MIKHYNDCFDGIPQTLANTKNTKECVASQMIDVSTSDRDDDSSITGISLSGAVDDNGVAKQAGGIKDQTKVKM